MTESDDRRVVLVVDDEDMVRGTLKQMLGLLGFTVVDAPDGHRAVEICAAGKVSFDLILLDLSIPGLSAREAYLEIRELGVDCPVMLMSGYDDRTAAHRFGDGDIDGFLQKPFNLEELRETLTT